MSSYRSLLGYIKSAVTRNYSEKSINNLLDYVSSSQQTDFMEEFYQTTLQALENDAKNEVRDALPAAIVANAAVRSACRSKQT